MQDVQNALCMDLCICKEPEAIGGKWCQVGNNPKQFRKGDQVCNNPKILTLKVTLKCEVRQAKLRAQLQRVSVIVSRALKVPQKCNNLWIYRTKCLVQRVQLTKTETITMRCTHCTVLISGLISFSNKLLLGKSIWKIRISDLIRMNNRFIWTSLWFSSLTVRWKIQ